MSTPETIAWRFAALGACMLFAVSCDSGGPSEPAPATPTQYAGRWVGTTSQSQAITLWVGSAGVMDSLRVQISVSIVSGMSSCVVTFTPANISLGSDRSFTATLTSATQVSGTLSGAFPSATTASGTFTAGWSGAIICGGNLTIGTGGSTSTGTWQATKSPMSVSGVSPNTGPLAGGTNVTIIGWFEAPVDSVRFGTGRLGNLARVSGTQLTGTAPAGAAAGAVSVTAYASAAGSVTCTNCFTYNPLPTVTVVTPSSGSVIGWTAVTITGTNFPTTVDSVRVGMGRLGSLGRVSSTQLMGITPAVGVAGTVDVVVYSTRAGDGRCTGCYTYTPPVTWVSLTVGGTHTCGLASGGIAYCWGDNTDGKLGDGSTTHRNRPVAVAGGLTFASLAAGFWYTCGVTSGGIAYCWGRNSSGQLGDGSTTQRTTPAAVTGGLTFASLAAGSNHACGLTSGGAAYCWGDNTDGKLGDSSVTRRTTPVAVAGGLTFASLTAGGGHTCGLTSGGVAYCWGSNFYGDLGDGSTTDRSTPVAVAGGLTFASLTAGYSHTCGVTSGGIAYCWGRNYYAELGDASFTNRSAPVAVAGGLSFARLTAGDYYHTCGLTTGGVAYCWGTNADGQLGDGSLATHSTPVAVAGGLTFASLGAGQNHTCGHAPGGTAFCWGDNGYGQLGIGSSGGSRTTPLAVVSP